MKVTAYQEEIVGIPPLKRKREEQAQPIASSRSDAVATSVSTSNTNASLSSCSSSDVSVNTSLNNNNNKKTTSILSSSTTVSPVITGKTRRKLPPELWATILDFCPFETVLSCSAVSTFFLRQAIPLVTRLNIFSRNELRVDLAQRRFPGGGQVQEINVYCLITCLDVDGDEENFSICQSTASRVVPFLCFFPKVLIVGLDVDKHGVNLQYYFRDSFVQADSVEIVRSLVRSICGAYQSRALSQNVKLYGPAFQAGTFICYRESGCGLCRLYCKSFPLDTAVNARAICLPVKEKLEIIAQRPRGKQILSSPKIVLERLEHYYQVPFSVPANRVNNGSNNSNSNNNSKNINGQAIVFSKDVMEELEILCQTYINTSKSLTTSQVLEALRNGDGDGGGGGKGTAAAIALNESIDDDDDDDMSTKNDQDEIWMVQKYHDFLTNLGIPLPSNQIKVVHESYVLSDVHKHM